MSNNFSFFDTVILPLTLSPVDVNISSKWWKYVVNYVVIGFYNTLSLLFSCFTLTLALFAYPHLTMSFTNIWKPMLWVVFSVFLIKSNFQCCIYLETEVVLLVFNLILINWRNLFCFSFSILCCSRARKTLSMRAAQVNNVRLVPLKVLSHLCLEGINSISIIR